MNDYYYDNFIKPYISFMDRKIICKKDRWLIGLYKLNNTLHKNHMANITIHTGGPCYRYCTCHYFTNEDKLFYYKSIQHHLSYL